LPTSYELDARFLRSVLAASDDCIKVLALDGTLAFMTEGGQRVMEISDFNTVRGCPWPDFWAGQGNADARHALDEARAGRHFRFQGAADTALGNPRYWDVQVGPIFGENGQVESILSVSRDITAMRAVEDRQRLLALELKHRMKNTIALIQAIASQTMRTGRIEDLLPAFLSRLATLGTAHDLLTQGDWEAAQISDVVAGSLRPHTAEGRFGIGGPDLGLSSKCALGLALAVHELATNATKYGALSRPGGHVEVTWTVEGEVFTFVWRESGGPPVTAPTRIGFGTRLVERALTGYFGGQARVDYDPKGLVFTLTAPAEALTAE
jgi:two-component sensor histidine kinase